MSHYGNGSWKQRYPVAYKDFTHFARKCWACGDEIIQLKDRKRGVAKICRNCKEKLTDAEIKVIYGKHFMHRNMQFKAGRMQQPPSEQRFIMNSPFRKEN